MVNIVSYSAAYAIFNNGVFSRTKEGFIYLFFLKYVLSLRNCEEQPKNETDIKASIKHI